jgi:hypothetical protein
MGESLGELLLLVELVAFFLLLQGLTGRATQIRTLRSSRRRGRRS